VELSGDEVLACLPNLMSLQRGHRWSVIVEAATEQ
jgi:hypothetical protein